jgi:hypothetical protein
MAKIISVKKLRDRLQFNDSDEINALLSKAIDSATLAIEAMLRTQLALKADNEELFLLSEYLDLCRGDSLGSCRLKNGYVDPNTVTVTYSYSMFEWTDAMILSNTDINVSTTNGLLYFNPGVLPYQSGYIKVNYTSGFTQDVSGVLVGVPDWLTECAMLAARELYRIDDLEVKLDSELGIAGMIIPHVRNYANTVKPVA